MPKKSEEKTATNKEELPVEETPKKEKEKKISEKEFEKKVIELAKKGITSEKIGETLRKEGIHSKDFPRKISKILKENNSYENPDLKNTEAKLKKVSEHYQKNKQDKRAKREKDRIFSQLRKVKKYLKLPLK
jgi:ribosomal protein S15P/S13E